MLLFCILTLSSIQIEAQSSKDEVAIRKVLEDQRLAWNTYDLDGFMQGYWKSDSLKFYGSGGLVSGWDSTLARYHKSYPSKEHTGTLKFVINDISKIDKASYYVMGEFHLEREAGNADGIFMIIFKKIDGEWKIIADTSC